MSKPEIADNWR